MRPVEAIRRLRREGWEERPGKGSHLIFRKESRRVVIANHRGDIPSGTLREICRRLLRRAEEQSPLAINSMIHATSSFRSKYPTT